MLIEYPEVKLSSLLLVFLAENFETSTNRCAVCDNTTPRFGKSFYIGGTWVCMDCIVQRIRTNSC